MLEPCLDLESKIKQLGETKIIHHCLIISTQWNSQYNNLMREDALVTLKNYAHTIDVLEAPGAFELPILAKRAIARNQYDVVICLGTVIQGATRHFDIVVNESARGIMTVMLETGVPIINGVLACNNEEEAGERAQLKGKEFALTAINLVIELQKAKL